jgi:predicted enzyme related to lactoylglutathione lyase
MPEISEFQPGLPSWADLATPDTDESISFYEGLFGWETREPGDGEEYGGYRVFVKGDKQVAGLMKIQQEGQPPSWSTYIAVSDADEVAEKVKEAGGDVMVEPMDVSDLGRMAFFADPTGAAFGVWQAKEHKGADLVSEPGATAWHQVNTRDPEKATEFYQAVFGWDCERLDTGGADYWEWQLEDKSVGGMFRMGDDFPEEVPAHWIVYFGVEDADAATEKAKESGAQVRAEPFDTEAGRLAVLTDPHGAAFAVINQGGGDVAGEEGEGDEESQEDGEGQEGEQAEDEQAEDEDGGDES